MKTKYSIIMMIAMLLLAGIACATGTTDEPVADSPPVESDTVAEDTADSESPVEDSNEESPADDSSAEDNQASDDPPPPPPPPAVSEGFTGKLIDASQLPDLAMPAVGMGPSPCISTDATNIKVERIFDDQRKLCIWEYPLEAGSPPMVITLTDPDGNEWVETFTIIEVAGNTIVKNETEDIIGEISIDDFGDGRPTITIPMYFTADMPTGTWTVTIDNGTYFYLGNFDIFWSAPRITVSASPPGTDPFRAVTNFDVLFQDGDSVYIAGAGFPNSTEITLAAYRAIIEPDAPVSMFAPAYATAITTDDSGVFMTEFLVGPKIPSNSYLLIDSPFTREFMEPFYGWFRVRE